MVRNMFVVAGVFYFLSGCAQQSAVVPSETTVASNAKVSLFDIELNSMETTVPFKVSELEKAGYTLQESTVDTVTRGVDNIAYYVDEEDGLVVVNLGSMEESCELADAYVIDILADKGNTDTSRLRVCDGAIGFDSSKEDIEALFGEPVFEDNGMVMYSMTEEDAYMDGVYVAMDGDEVIRVEVLSTKDFIDWSLEELEEFESESVSE